MRIVNAGLACCCLKQARHIHTKREFGRPLARVLLKYNGTFLQQLECGYGFPALIHVCIFLAGGVRMVYTTHEWRSLHLLCII